jgi:ABC-2 type transport system ATP-binding protein
MTSIIQASSVSKEFKVVNKQNSNIINFFFPSYSTIRAVDNVSLEIKRGEFVGLIGANGAGKTTLIRLLCGLLEPTEGNVLIEGKDIEQELRKIGVMLGPQMIYHRLTGYNNLKYFAKIYGVKKIDDRIKELVKFVDLEEKWLYNYVEFYSIGMKTRLALARALIQDPPILFLDEPTQGLDPWISQALREKIIEMKKTIILSSHSLLDLEQVCNRVILLEKGKIVSEQEPSQIGKLLQKER